MNLSTSSRLVIGLLAFMALGNPQASAAVTIIGGKPVMNDLGISLLARKFLTGLQPSRTTVILVADANVAAECTSPGGTTSHAVTADPISVAGIQVIRVNQISDGKAFMRPVTLPPDLNIEGAPQCPNSKWTETITDLSFTGAAITIRQQGSGIVLHKECTIIPSVNGRIPDANVVCK